MKDLKFRAYHKKQNRMFPVYAIGRDFVTEETLDGVNPGENCFSGDELEDIEVMLGSTVNDIEVFAGDIHKTDPVDVDGEMQSSYLPIVFDNGSFWIDESFEKDGSYLHLLSSYDEKLNIVGNIFENPELLTTETINR